MVTGAQIEPRNIYNQLLRQHKFEKSRKFYYKFLIILTLLAIVVNFIIYLTFPYIFKLLKVDPLVLREIDKCMYGVALITALYGIVYWPRNALVSLDLKPYMIGLNMFFGVFVRMVLTWYFVITLRYGLIGVYLADSIGTFIKVLIMLVVIRVIGESQFKGVED